MFRFMYAIVEIAGQQFKVEAGNEIFVQRLADAKGADVEFSKVLLVAEGADVKVGAPYVEGAVVKATVLDDNVKADKVLVFKKIRLSDEQREEERENVSHFALSASCSCRWSLHCPPKEKDVSVAGVRISPVCPLAVAEGLT